MRGLVEVSWFVWAGYSSHPIPTGQFLAVRMPNIPDVGEVVSIPFAGPCEPIWIVRRIGVEHEWIRIELEHLLDLQFRMVMIVPLWRFEAA